MAQDQFKRKLTAILSAEVEQLQLSKWGLLS